MCGEMERWRDGGSGMLRWIDGDYDMYVCILMS